MTAASDRIAATDLLIDPSWTVRDVTSRYPASVAIFKAHKVEACCDAGRPLPDAAAKAGIGLDELLSSLRAGLAGNS